MVAPPCYIWRMKDQKPAPNPDDIELHPDAWERFVDAVRKVARRPVTQADVKGKAAKPKPRPKRRGSSRA
jgi:hypothetical protein